MTPPACGNRHRKSGSNGRAEPGREWTILVGEQHDGTRLDRFLADRCRLGRRKVRRIIEAGLVSAELEQTKPGTKLKSGSRLRLAFDPDRLADQGPMPDPGVDLRVLKQTDNFIVLDKPPGIPSVALSPFETGTLANALSLAHPECVQASLQAGADPLEAGLIHRLDQDTSGIILAARTPQAYRLFREVTKQGQLFKRYVTLVQGRMQGAGEIDQAMVTLRHKPRKMGPAPQSSRPGDVLDAYSTYEVIESRTEVSLVEVTIARGRPHQVRFHLAHVGHPILGDGTYGGPPAPETIQPLALRCRAIQSTDTRCRIDLEIPIPRSWLDLFC